MKNRIQTIIIICLTALTLLFGFLWQREKSNRADLRMLAQASAKDAYTQFASYQERGEESDYWKGVAAFRSFEQAYYLLTENTNKNGNYVFCNEVYGDLVLHPQKCQEYMADIIAVLDILTRDVESENGHLKMSELRNRLEYD